MKDPWEFSDELEDRRRHLEITGHDSYCLQTMGGKEVELARELNIIYKDKEILVLPFLRITHKSKDGVKSTYQKVMLPGYVFLYISSGSDPSFIRPGGISFHFVRNVEKNDYLLRGSDKNYAQWVFNSGGIIGMSKAIKANGKVRIISGPLFNLIGNIKEYSKKNRNCRIETTLFNRQISMWLPFEWVEEIPEESKKENETKDTKMISPQ